MSVSSIVMLSIGTLCFLVSSKGVIIVSLKGIRIVSHGGGSVITRGGSAIISLGNSGIVGLGGSTIISLGSSGIVGLEGGTIVSTHFLYLIRKKSCIPTQQVINDLIPNIENVQLLACLIIVTAIAMQTLNNKQKEEVIVLQDESTKTKLSRQARIYKNKKLRHKQKQTEMLHSLNDDILLVIDNIIFDPSWVW
ncbi:3606_t:CDS:2 [Cetraspora pellucida]|uniref:3606_t:CDS:1 n=1 Tax=Cetraspora pellucida TaxID=1433469 RepID=A0A9N8WEP0_9GLOM|nr:3606_t:CDS:2 [Cetraspora pellucida]